MGFDPDQFLASTAPAAGFDPDKFLSDTEDKSIAGFGQNLWEDVKGTASGIGDLATGLTEHPIDTGVGLVKNLPRAVIDEGKRLGVGELLTGHPINAMEKFGQAAYDKPLTTALDVLPAAGAAGKAIGIGGKVAKGAEVAEQAVQAAKAAPTVTGALGKVAEMPGAKNVGIQAADDLSKAAENVIPLERVVGNTVQRSSPPPPAGGPPKITPKVVPDDLESTLLSAKKQGTDALSEVRDYITSKYGRAASNPGWPNRVAKYLQEEARNMGAKDIGLQPRQIQSMGQGFEGLQKAEALIDYARDQGYFKPGLTDMARKEKVKGALEQTGRQLGAVRDIAGKRGQPPVAQMLQEVNKQLTNSYGIDAPGEIKKVLAKIQKVAKGNPTYADIADLATDLNRSKTAAAKLGQHPGPTTDAANIISRLNNEAIKGVLNPEEAQLYTQSLRDFGAHKKLEQAIAAAERRGMSARSNQRGIFGRLWQEALDRGGYRLAGNVADRTARAILQNPQKVKTMPQFFEELAHHADDALDEALDVPGMAYGGVVGEEPMQPMVQDPVANTYQTQLQDAAQRGPQSLIATHYILMQRDPRYNMMYTQRMKDSDGAD